MKIVICDDEMNTAQEIELACGELCSRETDEICVYTNAENLWTDLPKFAAESTLFLLDIEMPVVDGMTIKTRIAEVCENASVVFLTDHTEMMEHAFGRQVIGFLSKTNYAERLQTYIDEARRETEMKCDIMASRGGETVPICSGKIVLVRANRVYSTLVIAKYYHAQTGELQTEEQTFRVSLDQWEQKLTADGFYRMSRSLIVNFAYVSRFPEGKQLWMDTGEQIDCPVKKRKRIRDAYNAYIQGRARVM